jgi:hypothetical protein
MRQLVRFREAVLLSAVSACSAGDLGADAASSSTVTATINDTTSFVSEIVTLERHPPFDLISITARQGQRSVVLDGISYGDAVSDPTLSLQSLSYSEIGVGEWTGDATDCEFGGDETSAGTYSAEMTGCDLSPSGATPPPGITVEVSIAIVIADLPPP